MRVEGFAHVSLGDIAMRVVLFVGVLVVCGGLFHGGESAKADQKEEGAKTKPNGAIQVQVTGILSGPPLEWGNAKEKAYAGAVFAGGRELFLDCAGNNAAKELLQKAYADLSKHTGFVPSKKVDVQGRLHFRPYLLYDAQGK